MINLSKKKKKKKPPENPWPCFLTLGQGSACSILTGSVENTHCDINESVLAKHIPLPGYLNIDTEFLEVRVVILDCGSDDRIVDPVREVRGVFLLVSQCSFHHVVLLIFIDFPSNTSVRFCWKRKVF